MTEQIGYEGLFIALINDGFMLVESEFDDKQVESIVAMECRDPQILIEIEHKKDIVTKITCSSENKEKCLPLNLSEFNIFIIGVRTKRNNLIIVN